MYTEDDEKVKLKKSDSNIEYSDFYTSFSEIENDESENKKSKSKKKELEKKEVENENQDETSFYSYDVDDDKEVDDNKSKKIIKIIMIVILAIILLFLTILSIKGCTRKVSGDILLSQESITLNVSEKAYISYKVINTESPVTSSFESLDSKIATVSSNGEVMGMGVGDTKIIVHYTTDGVTRDKECTIKVNNSKNVNQNLELSVTFASGANDKWTNKDVVINAVAKSVFEVSSLKYAVNCDSNCSYKDVTNNKITITNNGTTKVKVLATDKKKQEVAKEVIVKIDKEAPKATLNSEKNIKSNSDVTVCASCSDDLSGCKQKSVCKKYTSSKSNQVITVYDAAGNKKNSDTFNVTISKTGDPCTLKVSTDGTVTATLREEASYYGFNSSYTGSNELSQKITINASKKGESGAKVIYYYVKNKNGTGGKCYLTVVKKCECTDKNSTDANCPVTCTFSSQ